MSKIQKFKTSKIKTLNLLETEGPQQGPQGLMDPKGPKPSSGARRKGAKHP